MSICLGFVVFFGMCSSVGGDFLEANETTLVFGSSVGLEMPETSTAKTSIVMVFHGATSVVGHEVVFLGVARPEEVEHPGVGIVANSSQNHVVSLLDGNETHVFHGLHKRHSAAESLAGLLLQVLVQRLLLVKVVASPELHGDAPGDEELGKTTPDVRCVGKQFASSLLVEMTVAEHRRVSVEVSNTGALLHGRVREVGSPASHDPTKEK